MSFQVYSGSGVGSRVFGSCFGRRLSFLAPLGLEHYELRFDIDNGGFKSSRSPLDRDSRIFLHHVVILDTPDFSREKLASNEVVGIGEVGQRDY